jgi:acyl-[acyl-carrier-protein]-phospholipid O-acyltransferase/long-chain-fatty-acid--[acyl-carrier-protein] ligase
MVIHTLEVGALEVVLEKLAGTDLPNLWKPKRDQFVRVEVIPVLGTGKMDLRRIRELAGAQAVG